MEDLRQENERLKEYIQELASDNLNTIQEMDNERRRVEQLKEENEKLQEILQEIKDIAERAFAVCDDDCGNANKFKEIIELTKEEEE